MKDCKKEKIPIKYKKKNKIQIRKRRHQVLITKNKPIT
jgi:hypothetical protein